MQPRISRNGARVRPWGGNARLILARWPRTEQHVTLHVPQVLFYFVLHQPVETWRKIKGARGKRGGKQRTRVRDKRGTVVGERRARCAGARATEAVGRPHASTAGPTPGFRAGRRQKRRIRLPGKLFESGRCRITFRLSSTITIFVVGPAVAHLSRSSGFRAMISRRLRFTPSLALPLDDMPAPHARVRLPPGAAEERQRAAPVAAQLWLPRRRDHRRRGCPRFNPEAGRVHYPRLAAAIQDTRTEKALILKKKGSLLIGEKTIKRSQSRGRGKLYRRSPKKGGFRGPVKMEIDSFQQLLSPAGRRPLI